MRNHKTENDIVTIKKLGAFLETEARKRKINKSELSRLVGVDRMTITNIFKGSQNPSFTTLLAICQTLKIGITFLTEEIK